MTVYSKYDTKDQPYYNHSHSDCEIIYAESGAARFQFYDQYCLLQEKQLLLITALEEHAVTIVEKPYKRYCLGISRDRDWDANRTDVPAFPSLFFSHMKNGFYIFDFSGSYRDVESLLRQIQKESREKAAYAEAAVQSLTRLLLIQLCRCRPDLFRKEDPSVSGMRAVQQHIEAHFREPLRLEALAELIYVSPGYLSHAFKAYAGYSPKQYISVKRLQEAKRLLLTTNLSVADIARQSGFMDGNHFIRSFKKQFGLPPRQFRKKQASD